LIETLAPLGPVPGRHDLLAHQALDVFAVWQAWEKESGRKQDIPYWATVWPAATLAAKYLHGSSVTVDGKTVLDLGCGGGIAGIAALKAGAVSVIANDTDPVALAMAERNAAANGLCLRVESGNLLDAPPRREFEVILVADLFYDRTSARKMLAWLESARESGSKVFIADASRPFSPKTGVRILAEEILATDPDLEGSRERTVRFLAFRP